MAPCQKQRPPAAEENVAMGGLFTCLRGSRVGNSLPFPRGEGTGGVQVAVNRGHRYPQLLCNLGHGARPDLTNDPIKAACDLALQLSSIPSNYYDVLDHSVVSIGKITAGNIGNVIPSEAHIQGTTRQYKKGGNEAMLAVIERMAKGVGITHNVEVKVSHNSGVLPVYNDPALIPHARELVDQVEGLKVSPQTDPICAGDDFCYILDRFSGFYGVLGAGTPDSYPQHHCKFDVKESEFRKGAEFMGRYIVDYLG